MESVINDVLNVVNTWQTLGALAGVVLLLQLLMKALKYKPINEMFKKYKIKWIKPYIAMAFGATAGGIGAYLAGAEVANGIVAGVMAALTSVGWNESVNKLKSSNRGK